LTIRTVAVLLVAWLTLHVAPAVVRRLRLTGMHAIERVMGLIVMVIGVQFVIDGVQEVVVQTAAKVGGG
jgi:multiple antibiotic resistance protein